MMPIHHLVGRLDAPIVCLVIYIFFVHALVVFLIRLVSENRSRTQNLHVQFACIVLLFDFAIRLALFLLDADFLLLLLLSTLFFRLF